MAYKKPEGFVRPELKCDEGRKGVVYFDGRKHHVCAWDGAEPKPTPVIQAWLNVCLRLEKEWEAKKLGIELLPEHPGQFVSIAEVVRDYMAFLHTPEGGYVKPDGTESCHLRLMVQALRPLTAMFGTLPIAFFTAKELTEIKTAMDGHLWFDGEEKDKPRPWNRKTINRHISRIRRFFRYAGQHELLPPGRLDNLQAVPGWKKGYCKVAKEPKKKQRMVSDAHLEIILDLAPPPIADLLWVIRRTAMRPTEACLLRVRCPEEPSRGLFMHTEDGVWEYRPEDWKLDWMEDDEVDGEEDWIVFLGPDLQEVLQPYIERSAPEEYLFRPRDSFEWRRTHHRHKGKERKRPPTAAELRRVARAKEEAAKRIAKRKFLPRYNRRSLAQALERVIEKARKLGHDVPYFTPYDLRHTRLTEIKQNNPDGIRAAQAVGRHRKMNTTGYYLHDLAKVARQIAAQGINPPSRRRHAP
jgi:integrase